MEYKYTMNAEKAMPGIPVRIQERTADGLLIGEYLGYYNFRKNKFTLYPCYNPFALSTDKLRKKEIPAYWVRSTVRGGA